MAMVHNTSPELEYFQEAMKQLAALLPEGLQKEIYGLWEVTSPPS